MGSGWLLCLQKPGEAGGRPSGVSGQPGLPCALLDPRMCRGLQALAALQTAHSSGCSLVCSRSAGCLVSSVRCWEGYIHRLLAGAVGASLAALWGDSLRVSLLLLLHLLYNFPDLALCSLASKKMPDNSDDHFLILVWRLVTRHDNFCTCQVLQLVHGFPALANHPASGRRGDSDVGLQLHFFFGIKEVFFLQFPKDPS